MAYFPLAAAVEVVSDVQKNLDVISINIWEILISLANLLLLFLILKKFLYKPVKKILAQRRETVEEERRAAEEATKQAQENKSAWEQKLSEADREADEILKLAQTRAEKRGEKILSDAQAQAEDILARAKNDAELEKKKAEAGIRHEVVVVSTDLAKKLLEREVNPEDHRKLVEDFLKDMTPSPKQ